MLEAWDSKDCVFPKDQKKWLAVRVFCGKEQSINLHLQGRGVATFLPKCRNRRQWSDRIKSLTQSLFPGYVFVQIIPQDSTVVLRTPGVIDILSLRGEPTIIENGIIEAIMSRTDEHGMWQSGLKAGDRVRIIEGPYAGFVGDLERCEGEERVMVLLKLLNGLKWHVNVPSCDVIVEA